MLSAALNFIKKDQKWPFSDNIGEELRPARSECRR
jgi:hypothetical protein